MVEPETHTLNPTQQTQATVLHHMIRLHKDGVKDVPAQTLDQILPPQTQTATELLHELHTHSDIPIQPVPGESATYTLSTLEDAQSKLNTLLEHGIEPAQETTSGSEGAVVITRTIELSWDVLPIVQSVLTSDEYSGQYTVQTDTHPPTVDLTATPQKLYKLRSELSQETPEKYTW